MPPKPAPRTHAGTPTSNDTGWNGKLIMSHRGGASPGWHQGRTIGTLDPDRGYVGGENNNLHESLIRAGFAMAGGSLMVTGTTANHVVQAETVAKIKERFRRLMRLFNWAARRAPAPCPIGWRGFRIWIG